MKGVILAAGYGTRFLPASKTIPKEMFPLIDTPVIDLIIKEMLEAGIQDILVVSSRRKKAMEDYFDREVELEATFTGAGFEEKMRLIHPIPVNIFFMRQQRMAGTGDALLMVEPFVGDSPFVVAYPDDVLINGPSLSGQLIDTHRKTGRMVLAMQEVPTGDISRFGVAAVDKKLDVEYITRMVEKPAKGTEPSRLVSFGRYLYTPDIFDALRESRQGHDPSKEFTQTDAINYIAGQGRVVARRIEGTLLDVGTPMGYMRAQMDYCLSRPDFKDKMVDLIHEMAQRPEVKGKK